MLLKETTETNSFLGIVMNLLLNLYKMTEMCSQVFCGIQGHLHTVP